ncbi:MAG: hypothetical protein J0I12_25880 [Candidatus Eremiobacteraeota bacterium]|nr:hypothetical protein [Candidatus Eremiobacteraeota bacterium]
MIMADTVLSGKVNNELEEELRQSGLMGPFLDVTSPRFIKFLLQPKLIMRSDWLFDPQNDVTEREVRAYVLRAPHDFAKEGVLQQLIIDRTQRKASLVTQGSSKCQTIEVDLRSFEVLANHSGERTPQ